VIVPITPYTQNITGSFLNKKCGDIMEKTKILIMTLSVLFLILSCTSTTEPDDEIIIKGRVTNSSGNPVSDAKIMLTYYTESLNSRPTTTFSYALTESKRIKLWITYHNTIDTVKVLVDEIQQLGHHTVQWDATNNNELVLVSNFYDWHLKIGGNQIDEKLLLNMIYNNITGDDVNNYECFTITDDYGHYDFGIDKLPFSFSDNEIEVQDENGFVIDTLRVTRKVMIWAIHSDYDPVFIDSVYVNVDSKTVGNLSFD